MYLNVLNASGSEYASVSGYTTVLNMPGFSTCQGSQCASFVNILGCWMYLWF